MSDAQEGNGRVKAAVQEILLRKMDGKLDSLLKDHDLLVRLDMQVEQNKQDIAGLAKSVRDKDSRGRRESLVEMMIAAIIGASAWLRP